MQRILGGGLPNLWVTVAKELREIAQGLASGVGPLHVHALSHYGQDLLAASAHHVNVFVS